MDRTYCDVCGKDISDYMFRPVETQKIVKIWDGFCWIELKLCKRCYKRFMWLLENDRYKEAIINMGFLNRVRLALMLPLKYGKPGENGDENVLKIKTVKRALRICADGEKSCYDDNCPYCDEDSCQRDIARDALEIIENLEERIAIMEEGKNANS